MTREAIAVIDFGGQYAHLIATKIRSLKVFAEILQPDDPIDRFRSYKGIIISGSPALASQGEESEYTKEIYDLDVPILGFCFGHQEIAKHYGGVVSHRGAEWGPAILQQTREHPLFKGLGPHERVWMSHYDSVVSLGPDFEELGFSSWGDAEDDHRNAAIASDRLRRYGFQFHPEVDDTEHGEIMLANFLFDICGCSPLWSMESYVRDREEWIRRQVGDRSVFLLVSGGVDSTVAARLMSRALRPEQLHMLHIDNGLMRKNESRTVVDTFHAWGLREQLHFVDASDTFLDALANATEPEEKRTIIGETFIRVFQEQALRLGIGNQLLGQGTIYPDTIESAGTKRADKIKTHHNRAPIVEQMIARGEVVEPLAELYKKEVRELGEQLDIPKELVWRHPFPGPGLGVRLLCSATAGDATPQADLQSQVDRVTHRLGIAAAVLPFRSVGVKADLRSYEHPVLLHGDASPETISEAAGTIFKEVSGINRCVWLIGQPMPKSLFRPKAGLTRARLELLREADFIVMEALKNHDLYRTVWQCPTVLAPLTLDGKGKELVIVRPVLSERGMTAAPAFLPKSAMKAIIRACQELPDVSAVVFDVTPKPPGTIEWE